MKYYTIQIRPVDMMWINKFNSKEHPKDSIIWISTYFENLKPVNSVKFESKEYWIDCLSGEYQYLSDIWTDNGKGFTTPDYYVWKKLQQKDNDIVNRLFNGFCNCN